MRKGGVRVGIIGAGYIAQQSHIPAYLTNPRTRVIGVADPDTSRLDEIKKKFKIDTLFENYLELLEADLDAVSICVPTRYHSEITVESASRGINVLCEKPIALTLKEADRMIGACEKHNVKLMVGFNYRFIATHREAKKLMEKGRIGKPFFIHGQFASTGPYKNLEKMSGSFYLNPEQGGGVLFDSGSHLFDLMRWYFGEIESVQAYMGTYDETVAVDDVTSVIMRFRSGRIGCLTCMWTKIESWSAMRDEGFIKVMGDEGKLVASLFSPSLKFFNRRSKMCKMLGEIELSPHGFDPKRPMDTLTRSWRDEIDAFVGAVRMNTTVPITGYDGRRALELVLQAYQSAGVRG